MPRRIKKCLSHHCCSRTVTGKNFFLHPMYSCETCSISCLCSACAEYCHSQNGHIIKQKGKKMFFCDCKESGKCVVDNEVCFLSSLLLSTISFCMHFILLSHISYFTIFIFTNLLVEREKKGGKEKEKEMSI